MSKVLFITEKVSFISEGIINHLKAQDFEVLTVKPDVTAISNFLKEDNGNDEEAIDPEVAALLSQESGEPMNNFILPEKTVNLLFGGKYLDIIIKYLQ
ncbi:MAG: hypothetical protein IKN30_03260, partial [Synergistaceae bacterium]|nr:hypothetical protein [Synergistaceae bacterium]